MSRPVDPPFNPKVSKVAVIDSSSGDPAAKNDPKSTASIAANIQIMQDQSKADQLYDPKVSGFQDYIPWIVTTPACRRTQGFMDINSQSILNFQTKITTRIAVVGAVLVIVSFFINNREK